MTTAKISFKSFEITNFSLKDKIGEAKIVTRVFGLRDRTKKLPPKLLKYKYMLMFTKQGREALDLIAKAIESYLTRILRDGKILTSKEKVKVLTVWIESTYFVGNDWIKIFKFKFDITKDGT